LSFRSTSEIIAASEAAPRRSTIGHGSIHSNREIPISLSDVVNMMLDQNLDIASIA